MKPSKPLSILCSLFLALFLLTAAIAAPILCRPFYYAQIDSLALPQRTGWSEDTIRDAFDEVMDYLVKDAPFGTGTLKWSESGRAHFADCRDLFRLDFILLGTSAAALAVLALTLKLGRRSAYRFWGRDPAFWAMAGMLVFFLVLAAWALLDFEGLFTAFHTVFFPGKTNWIFDAGTDQIIRILPEAFWARAGALVLGLALGGAVLVTLITELVHWRRTPKNVYEEARAL
ncbi:TIGR01906 family membrane protein [Pseudoflavonifractor phocaeensis]|uniref:TIGR01906 family membrane protein n=1 Tax=Pseudoflavonifractor phocaeensis TaxID=1870988 RepID=UPI00313E5115